MKEQMVKEPIAVKMTAEDLKQLRLRVRFSAQDVANYLNVSLETVILRETGKQPITREIELAMRFLLISEAGEYHFRWNRTQI